MRMTELSAAQRSYTEQACQSSQALLRLVDDILDLSRIEAGRLELEKAPFHLPALIQDLRILFADQARAKGLTLSVSVPHNLNVMLVGDKHRLLQVLANLVGNAVKFTQQGSVAVNVSRTALDNGWAILRFEIADTGIGVATDKQDMIFDAFSQADASMTRRYGGTGLGLSIARQLCQMMGGDIGLTSVVGAGSTFWFTVRMEVGAAAPQPRVIPTATQAPVAAAPPTPVAAAPPTPVAAAPTAPAPAEGALSAVAREFQAALRTAGRDTVHILLVEDNAANMRVTKALLEILGCVVTPAYNGLAAVEEYRNGTFDLVLMDCQMPEMDGYEATRTIRQLETVQGRRTPIVALTAHAMAGSREASLEAGMDDQLTKPLTMAALTAKLVEWLAGAKSAQPAA